jgi:hypothetical protein
MQWTLKHIKDDQLRFRDWAYVKTDSGKIKHVVINGPKLFSPQTDWIVYTGVSDTNQPIDVYVRIQNVQKDKVGMIVALIKHNLAQLVWKPFKRLK